VSDCPFCKRIETHDYDWVTHYNAGRGRCEVVSFEPLNPVTPGHRLFMPRRHVRNAAEHPLTAKMVFGYAAAYGADMRKDFNLITSVGPAATQTVQHLHIHYVPRRPGDGLTLPWTVTP